MKKSWWLYIYHTTDVQSSQAHHLSNCPWLCLFQLFFPICTHWVTFKLWDKGRLIFLFLCKTTEIFWASLKTCHIPKRPENLPMAVTCRGMTDRLPVRRSGDTSAMNLFILGVILSLPMVLYSKKVAICWIFQQGCLILAVGELGKNRPRELLDKLKW